MYEDSQRFSDEEGERSSHVVSLHPRLMGAVVGGQIGSRVNGTIQDNPSALMMQHDVDEYASSL